MKNTVDILKSIALTFAYTSIHPDDVEKFMIQYVELNFPTHRYSKEWALRNLKYDYQRLVDNINKMKGEENESNTE